jgi:hypothetical protein
MARRDLFSTIRTEGALLPTDFLQRLADPAAKVEGAAPDTYHLAGEKLGEAASRSWNHLLGCWNTFQSATQALPEKDPGTTITRERWLLPLFQELGYGRLQTAKAIEIDEKPHPSSHAWGTTPLLLAFRQPRIALNPQVCSEASPALESHAVQLVEINRRSAR